MGFAVFYIESQIMQEQEQQQAQDEFFMREALGLAQQGAALGEEIGRASCRERV